MLSAPNTLISPTEKAAHASPLTPFEKPRNSGMYFYRSFARAFVHGASSSRKWQTGITPAREQKSRPHPKRKRSCFMVPEAGSRKGFAPRPARGKNQDRIQRGCGLALWCRKRGVERGSPPARQGNKNQDRIHGGSGLALWCRKRGSNPHPVARTGF